MKAKKILKWLERFLSRRIEERAEQIGPLISRRRSYLESPKKWFLTLFSVGLAFFFSLLILQIFMIFFMREVNQDLLTALSYIAVGLVGVLIGRNG